MRSIYVLCAPLLAILFSCTPTSPRYSAPGTPANDPEVITRSLFDSKSRTISEEDIQRLLNGRIVIPDTVNIAIYKFASTSINRYYTNWRTDEEYLKTQQSFADTLIRFIGTERRVRKVIPVPSLMTSASPDITQLRETAVRLKADLLVVYSVTSDIYVKYKLLDKDQAKAFATCEAILMDVRTGVIPHTSIVTREKLLTKTDQDLNNSELRKRAEREAVLLTLGETGREIETFLKKK